nr:hypothetical protein [Bacteroidota bacterium]
MKNKLHILITLTLTFLFSTLLIAQPIPDFQVNENASPDGSEQSECAIAGDASGNYIVTWKDRRNGSDFDIYAQIYLNDGTPSGTNFRVNDDSVSTWQERPSVGVDPYGNFVIVWIDRRNSYQDKDIYAQRFSADGTPLGNNFRVNDDPGNSFPEQPDISVSTSGKIIISWEDRRNGNRDIWAQRYLADGSLVGDNFMVSDDPGPDDQQNPSVSINSEGKFVISWEDNRNGHSDVYARRFSADGVPVGSSFLVNDESFITYEYTTDVYMAPNGNFTITWDDHRLGFLGNIFAQSYASNGVASGNNFKVNDNLESGNQCQPSLALGANNSFIITW